MKFKFKNINFNLIKPFCCIAFCFPFYSVAGISDIPVNTKDYQNTSFDWRQKHWLINNFTNYSNHSVIRVTSPFYSNDIEKFPFSAKAGSSGKPDFAAEDGWELIHQELGFDSNGAEQENKEYSYPYIALYNRSRGIVRVVSYINHAPYTYNSVELSLSVQGDNPNDKPLNLFSTYKPTGSHDIENYPREATSLARYYVHDSGQFVFGDFPISYDPCVGTTNLKMAVRISPIQQATIKLSGRYLGTESDVVKEGGYMQRNFLSSYIKSGSKLDPDSLGILSYQNYQRLFNETDHERFAKAVYKEKGDANLDMLIKGLQSGISIVSSAASFVGVPIAPEILSKASEGLNYFDFAPTQELDGFKMPEPTSFMSVGEMALRGSSKVSSAVRMMTFPLPGSINSTKSPLGTFNLMDIPQAEVMAYPAPGNTRYAKIWTEDNGYTLKGAVFVRKEGPRITFNTVELAAALSQDARDAGTKVLIALEAVLENTSKNDGQQFYPSKPQAICGFYQCAENFGLERQVITTTPIDFDQWRDTYGKNTINFSLPGYKQGIYRTRYKNIKLALKVWVVPAYLMDDFTGDIHNLKRKSALRSVQLYSYPIKFTVTPSTRESTYLTGENGGFEMAADNVKGANLRTKPAIYAETKDTVNGKQTNIVTSVSGSMCNYRQ